MRPARRSLRFLLAALFVPVVVSCGLKEALPHPDCLAGDTAILAAQSVPGATLVPCFDRIPAGWEVDSVTIDQDGTVVRFDSDRAGTDAAVFRYTEVCDRAGAVSAPSEIRGANRYDLIERVAPAFRARRFYEFAGGCMWWEFDFDAGATAGLSIELGNQLSAVSRTEFNDSLRESFVDEDL
jgi:hypothetical protein